MTNKKLATYQSYDPNSIVSCGSDWSLYADGRVSATTRSRWQGSSDGDRWLMHDAINIDSVGPDGGDDSAESMLTSFAHDAERNYYDFNEAGMSLVKSGSIVC